MTDTNVTQTPEVQAPEVQAPVVPVTRREKLLAKYNDLFAKRASLDGTITELYNEITSIDALAAVTVGSAVQITVGKGEAAKVVHATVIGVREEDDGSKTYKVAHGEGFDADVAVVKGSKIKLPATEGVSAE